jgi:ribosomal protein S10
MVWNRRTDARFHKISNGMAVDRKDIHGHRLVPNDKEDWIVIRDTHQGLIDRRQFEIAKNKRLNKIESIQQRGIDPRLKTHGKTWDGKRSRFILSGLITCSKCSSRYQGFTSAKGKTNLDGTKTKNFYYACGGYISRGNSVCQLNSIPQEILEQAVIEQILEFYEKYMDEDGRELLAEKVKSQINLENIDFKSAKQRVDQELQRNDQIINNLLDNLTAQNRELVDKRLNDLKNQKILLESRLEELDRLQSSQDEILNIVSQTLTFISSLEYTLKNGLPQEKLVAIRQCVQRIWVDKEAGKLQIDIYSVPAGNIKITESITAELQLPTNSIVAG